MRWTVVAGVFLWLLGCEQRKAGSDTGPFASASNSAVTARAALSAGTERLRAGPALPAEIEGVLIHCKSIEDKNIDERRSARECRAFQEWSASSLAKDKSGEKELIELLFDPRGAVRFLAAQALTEHACWNGGCPYQTNPAIAERLVTACEKKHEERVQSFCGRLIANIEQEPTKLGERIESLVMNGPEKMAITILGGWLKTNPALFPKVDALVRSRRKPGLRKGALLGLAYAFGSEHHDKACRLLLDDFNGLEDETVLRLIVSGAFGHRCTGSWDEFLSKLEQLTQPDLGTGAWVELALRLEEEKEATSQQKARVIAIARRVAENTKNHLSPRSAALTFLSRRGPEPLAYLRRFANDPNPYLAREVERLRIQLGDPAVTNSPLTARRKTEPRAVPSGASGPSSSVSRPVSGTPSAPPGTGAEPKPEERERRAVNERLTELLVPEGETWNDSAELLDGGQWADLVREARLTPDGRVWIVSGGTRVRSLDATTGA